MVHGGRRATRRGVLGVAACAMLGAVTAVAVAWGLTYFSTVDWAEQRTVFARHDDAVWAADQWSGPGARTTKWHAVARPQAGFDADEHADFLSGVWRGTPEYRRASPERPAPVQRARLTTHVQAWEGVSGLVEYERGWPVRAMWCYYRSTRSSATSSWHGGIAFRETTVATGWYGGSMDVLPILPIWSGLIVNTAVYGGAWWLVLIGPRRARRWRRRRRGWCVACGYDLEGQVVGGCPECGLGREVAA